MSLFRVVLAPVVALLVSNQVFAAPPAHAPQVVGWVPAYAVPAALEAIDADPMIGKTLTRIGLQFWNPSPDGRGLVFAPIDKTGTPLDASAVHRIRDWAHARGIEVLLTVYNNSETTLVWDWELARRAFKDQRRPFTRALVAEMEKYGLDGIDLDLEGEGRFDADRAAYARFVDGLSKKLRARGKLLTIDTFHSPCYNAPNMSWWADWTGKIDALHSMGYMDLYEASEETFKVDDQPCAGGEHIFKYSWQLAYGIKAGYRADQIVLGQPTWVDHWGRAGAETDAASHIREAQALGAGVALWDLQLSAPLWRAPATWMAMHQLRAAPGAGWQTLVPRPAAAAP